MQSFAGIFPFLLAAVEEQGGEVIVGLRRMVRGAYVAPDLGASGLDAPNPKEPTAFLRKADEEQAKHLRSQRGTLGNFHKKCRGAIS